MTNVSLVRFPVTCEQHKHVSDQKTWWKSFGCFTEFASHHFSKLATRAGVKAKGELLLSVTNAAAF